MDELKSPESQPRGYVIGDQRRITDLLAMQAELLRSEGLESEWPGFETGDKRGGGKKDDQPKKPA